MADITPIRNGWTIYAIHGVQDGPMGLTTRYEILDPDGEKRFELYTPMTDNEANAFVIGWEFGHREGLRDGIERGAQGIRGAIRQALGL